MKESDIQKKVIDYLHSLGAWTCKVISGNKAGILDIVACVPMTKDQVLEIFKDQDTIGVFVSPEIKNPNGLGVTSPLQGRNVKQINRAGGLAASNIISVADVKKLVTEKKVVKLRRSRS